MAGRSRGGDQKQKQLEVTARAARGTYTDRRKKSQ